MAQLAKVANSQTNSIAAAVRRGRGRSLAVDMNRVADERWPVSALMLGASAALRLTLVKLTSCWNSGTALHGYFAASMTVTT